MEVGSQESENDTPRRKNGGPRNETGSIVAFQCLRFIAGHISSWLYRRFTIFSTPLFLFFFVEIQIRVRAIFTERSKARSSKVPPPRWDGSVISAFPFVLIKRNVAKFKTLRSVMSSIFKKGKREKEKERQRGEKKNKNTANFLLFLSVAFRISNYRGRG